MATNINNTQYMGFRRIEIILLFLVGYQPSSSFREQSRFLRNKVESDGDLQHPPPYPVLQNMSAHIHEHIHVPMCAYIHTQTHMLTEAHEHTHSCAHKCIQTNTTHTHTIKNSEIKQVNISDFKLTFKYVITLEEHFI